VGFEDGGAEADAAEVRSAIDKVIQEAESVFLGHISSELGAEAGEAVRRGLLVRTGRCPDADAGDADRLLEAAFASQVISDPPSPALPCLPQTWSHSFLFSD
jgi:hypothetical protein